MRIERVALAIDAAFLVLAWWWIAAARNDAGLGALFLLIVLLAIPAPGRPMGPVALLIAAGVLVGTVALTSAGTRLGDPYTGVVDPRTALAVVTATAALVGIVWLLLWRAIADRPATWKPGAFATCLLVFVLAPALVVARGSFAGPDRWLGRLGWAASALAIAAAAALPYVDAAWKTTPTASAPLRKRL